MPATLSRYADHRNRVARRRWTERPVRFFTNTRNGTGRESGTLGSMNSDERETNARPLGSKDEVALEMMRFIAVTTGIGKTSAGPGFAGKPPKTPEEQVDALIQLYERCRAAVEKAG
jgi:hypothetical protein